jgi:hypothetical protein
MCNRCTFEAMIRFATGTDSTVTTRPKTLEGEPTLNGFDIFRVYRGQETWMGWLSGINDECSCGRDTSVR